ncbi:hypothetical protein HG535_0D05850 [Zygotorulaspora mrakii]|uniref:DUF726 domain-containing protein n=1 Tax=Zygotorulaspora mrakii TaxID=42260 RepID=A0A7H9B367_ZYGMR|nr:uncharacterized protein HG535_0D05850 [Zygotorulaspora mrakii]QLG72876.1 hypothetical protein HG535_0D05850 [Zygotorulaspora mrakii]
MSDSEEDLGFQLKTLKIASKAQSRHGCDDSSNLKNAMMPEEEYGDLAAPSTNSVVQNESVDTDQYEGDRQKDKMEGAQINEEPNEDQSKALDYEKTSLRSSRASENSRSCGPEQVSSTEMGHETTTGSDYNENAANDQERLDLAHDLDLNLDTDSDGEWQNMNAIASYNVYNEKGELDLRTHGDDNTRTLSQEMLSQTMNHLGNYNGVSPEQKKTATFGYTKVAAEEQAYRSYNANRKTDFLFDHKRMKKLNDSKNSLSGNADSVSHTETEKDSYDEYEEDVEPMDDLNADTQLNITRSLLSDKEKFAYVGAINVLSNQLCTDLATLCLCTDIVSHKKLAQRLQFAQKDTARWKTEILHRLYEHLGLIFEEIQMIEKLSMHGVRLEDLCKCLQTTQSINNPFEVNDVEEQDILEKKEKEGPKEETEKHDRADEDTQAPVKEVLLNSESDVKAGSVRDHDTPNDKTTESNADTPDVNVVPTEIIQPQNIKNQGQLEVDITWTIICDLFLLLLQDATYDARSRTLLIKFGDLLNINNVEICEFERRVTDSLDMEQSTEDQVWNESEHMKDRRKRRKRRKMCYVGLAMVGGSLVLGLSGGLLAPVIGAGIAAGLSTIGITGATGFLTGAGGATVVALTSTAIGGNIGARGMSKRMGSVRTFEFRPLHNNRRVNLIISVSGWMIGNEDDVRLPYSTVDPVEGDLYSLFWEPEMLKSIGQTINIVANEVFTQVIQQVLGATILTAFISAIQWPMGLSKLGYILDNPWSVSLDRAWAAGLILADTLMSRNLGERPVTLMGFSLGSRVIYSCLVELCKRKAHGLIENVFIFGTPVVRKKEHLVMARSVVSGRFVNAYSLKDWMLAYLFRAAAGGFSKVMGIAPVEGVEGVENFDCTETVDGHLAYRKNMPKLLKQLGVSVVSEEFVEIEETMDPEQVKRQRKLVHDVDAAQKKLLEKKSHNGWIPKWMRPKKSKWRTMVEDAVEEANDLESVEELSPELPQVKKRDHALVDHAALMHELQLIKAALHEGQLNNQNIEEEIPSKADIEPPQREQKSAEKCREETAPPAVSSNNFQLLTAGRTVLPEDDSSKNKAMEFAFADDF